MIAYVPVYCCVNTVPTAFRRENNPHDTFNENGAFWMTNFVSNMVYPRYSVMIDDLREAQKELEDYYAEELDKVSDAVKDLTARERVKYLTERSEQDTRKMMERWDKLARLLIVKHNDQIMRPSRDGAIAPGRYSTPGYNKSFYEQIGKDTGDRYLLRTDKDVETVNKATSTL